MITGRLMEVQLYLTIYSHRDKTIFIIIIIIIIIIITIVIHK